MQTIKSIAITLLWLAIVLVTPSQSAYACSPDETYVPPTLREHIEETSIILEGRVITTYWTTGWEQTAVVKVKRYFKGGEDQPETVVIDGFGDTDTCLQTLYVDTDHIFFAVGGDQQGTFHAEYFDAWDSARHSDSDTINVILEVTGQDPIIPQLNSRAENFSVNKDSLIILLGLLIVLAIILWIIRGLRQSADLRL